MHIMQRLLLDGGILTAMRGFALIIALALTTPAIADDAWLGWETPPDGQNNGIDVSFRSSTASTCTT